MVNILEHISVVIQLTPSNSLSPVTALHAVICQWCVLMESSSSAYRGVENYHITTCTLKNKFLLLCMVTVHIPYTQAHVKDWDQ